MTAALRQVTMNRALSGILGHIEVFSRTSLDCPRILRRGHAESLVARLMDRFRQSFPIWRSDVVKGKVNCMSSLCLVGGRGRSELKQIDARGSCTSEASRQSRTWPETSARDLHGLTEGGSRDLDVWCWKSKRATKLNLRALDCSLS